VSGEGWVLLVDKPEGPTSFAMVQRVRRLTGVKKVGHAGTLDPFASGLLVVCIGRAATRHVDRFMKGHKEYLATLQLGAATTTQDLEGETIASHEVTKEHFDRLPQVIKGFVGEQLQAVPRFSAVKHKGRPLYVYARKGIEVDKPPRKVVIQSIDLVELDAARARAVIRVRCGKGTYIRTLASDIGERLGCLAHLVQLRRLAVGGFRVDQAVDGGTLFGLGGETLVRQGLLPIDEAVGSCQEEQQQTA